MGCSSTSCDPAFDDDDFTAVAMCCSCGGGSTMPVAPACSDTDNGAVNSVGASCGVCSLPSEVPSSVLGRGGFDFAVSMRVSVDGVFQTSGKLAAFVGDEVRGVATPSAVPFGALVDDGTVLFEVSVWAAQTEVLTWKFCDGARMVGLEPPCSFTDAEVAVPPFRPMCTSGTFAAGYGGPFVVDQYFTGDSAGGSSSGQCTSGQLTEWHDDDDFTASTLTLTLALTIALTPTLALTLTLTLTRRPPCAARAAAARRRPRTRPARVGRSSAPSPASPARLTTLT